MITQLIHSLNPILALNMPARQNKYMDNNVSFLQASVIHKGSVLYRGFQLINFHQPSKSSGFRFLLQAVISVMWTGKSGLRTTNPLVKFSAISTRLLQINHNIHAYCICTPNWLVVINMRNYRQIKTHPTSNNCFNSNTASDHLFLQILSHWLQLKAKTKPANS